jgi:hypothetical protein
VRLTCSASPPRSRFFNFFLVAWVRAGTFMCYRQVGMCMRLVAIHAGMVVGIPSLTAATHAATCCLRYTWLLISSRCDVISTDRVHGYTPQLLADFRTL